MVDSESVSLGTHLDPLPRSLLTNKTDKVLSSIGCASARVLASLFPRRALIDGISFPLTLQRWMAARNPSASSPWTQRPALIDY